MSDDPRIKISCDNFDCTNTISSGVGLTDARTITGKAGWVNTIHYGGTQNRVILQDFCPEHRDQTFEWRAPSAQAMFDQDEKRKP